MVRPFNSEKKKKKIATSTILTSILVLWSLTEMARF